MRPASLSAAALATLLVATLGVPVALADDPSDPGVPSQQDVRRAESRAVSAADGLPALRGALAEAGRAVEEAQIRAAAAAEAFNGARYRAEQAIAAADLADQEAADAAADVERQRSTYAGTVVTSYKTLPSLGALASIADSDGVADVVEKTATLGVAEDALASTYDGFKQASTRATVTADAAARAEDEATEAAEETRAMREAAHQAADAATAQAADLASQEDALVTEIARLRGISVELAAERQSGLEARAAAEAQAAREREQRRAERNEQVRQTQQEPDSDASPSPDPDPAPAPEQPAPEPPSAPPASAQGGQAAVAFARAQLGETYSWGAAGPDAWDCSGLTMGAWAAAGKTLPHYSVAQYEASTPISSSDLSPGDLVFWGSSSSPSSIYHVALYAGNGMIIHAPRAGRPVVEESIHYWIPPNFHARP